MVSVPKFVNVIRVNLLEYVNVLLCVYCFVSNGEQSGKLSLMKRVCIMDLLSLSFCLIGTSLIYLDCKQQKRRTSRQKSELAELSGSQTFAHLSSQLAT